MNPLSWLRERFLTVLESGTGDNRRPILDRNNQSSVPGLFVVGDLAGAPVIKLAMAQGFEVVDHIASLRDGRGSDSEVLDLVVVGASRGTPPRDSTAVIEQLLISTWR